MKLAIDNISQKKELGQFFSGKSVAKLLMTLAKSGEATTVIDPMCGNGDMLFQFDLNRSSTLHLSGIEIDPSVFSDLKIRMGESSSLNLIEGNAFDLAVINQMDPRGYDLVITNPPYVRYQTVNKFEKKFSRALGMQEIRKNLITSLTHFTSITEEERQFVKSIISHLSGLSDLAVPSWILCSLLVKVGGRLAIVVPETWLNRDYAQIVKYLLLRWFQIEYIIEDANSKWFPSAQVKTILLVAKRIKAKDSIVSWETEQFSYTQLFSNAISHDSLVGNAYANSLVPEKEFINAIDMERSIMNIFHSRKILISEFAQELHTSVSEKKWFKLLHGKKSQIQNEPKRLKPSSSLLAWCDFSEIKFSQLSDLGVSVSQGLRTGANNFFYLDYERQDNNDLFKIYPNTKTGVQPFLIDRKYFSKVVRKQSELPNRFSLKDHISNGVVLSLQNFALLEDILYTNKCNSEFDGRYQVIPEPLANYVRIASRLRNGNLPDDNLLPNLSAVKPNTRLWNEKKPDLIPKFWYMLPTFSKRHFPDLFVPRINGGSVKALINTDCNFIIDANFSSIWVSNDRSRYNNFALLALLNSTWALIAMEEYGTVMGGGALKLEATQLNQIPFPELDIISISTLTKLGRVLSMSALENNSLIYKIDQVILSALGFTSNYAEKQQELLQIKTNLLKKRMTR